MPHKKALICILFLATSFRSYAEDETNPENLLSQYISPGNVQTNKELYNPNLSSADYHNALIHALGWIDDPNGASLRCQKCGGYYDESYFPQPSNLSFAEAPTTIKANPPISYKINGQIVFDNGVAIQQPGRVLYATNATITPNLKTGKLDAISADNGARLELPGQLLLAKSINADLVDHHAEMDQVNYLFKVGDTSPYFNADKETYDPIFSGFAHGSANSAKQLNAHQFSLKDATYSTCAPTGGTWELEASTINLDKTTGEGQAYNMIFKIHGVPLFYLPYFDFPINTERKSGFLYGTISPKAPNNGGAFISIPYYFNLAPNYDDTFTPNIYTKRGVLFTDTFRYLTPTSSGNIGGQFIPSDQQYNFQNRYSYAVNDATNFSDSWSGKINYNAVSDQDFLSDFSLQNLFGANQILLNRSANLNYQNLHWNVQGLLQSYQIINPTLITVNRPYQELPALNATAQYPNILGPLNFSLDTSYVDFQKSAASNFEVSPVNGQRTNLEPTLALPLTASYGYVTPAVTLDSTYYSLTNNVANGFSESNPSINVPIFDVDTSLYFDRPLQLGGKSYTQTIAPRLFYLYVPYQNQNNIPIFDTSINTFDYGQLFSTNRFTGLDRIGDANQLSYALTTQINNSKGDQLLNAGLGEIYYFSNRKVSLCQNSPGAPNPCITTENPFYNKHFSDVAGFFDYHFNPAWSFDWGITYNPNINLVDSQNYALQYIPNSLDVFNIGYQTNHQNYSLLSTQQLLAGTAAPISSVINGSFVYGLNPTWALIGSINYSIQNNGVINQFVGIQYSACCWAIRLLDYKYVTNSNPNTPDVLTGPTDRVYMVQFLLKGLGSTGGQGSTLLGTIPGYTNQLGF